MLADRMQILTNHMKYIHQKKERIWNEIATNKT